MKCVLPCKANVGSVQISAEFGYYGAFLEKAEVRNKIHVGNLTYSDGLTAEKILIAVRNEY